MTDHKPFHECRLCPTCAHFFVDLGSDGYSEYTPGHAGTMECLKGKWSLRPDTATMRSARHAMRRADTCKLFELYREDA